MRRAPARPVHAFFPQTVALMSKNRTCARPRCSATPSKHFLHSSHCTLHTALHTSHLHFISTLPSELFSSHFMSSHMSAKFFLTVFISSQQSSTFLISAKLVSTHLSSSARQKAWDTDAFIQKSLYKMLCTTKLAQSTSQYYFVLQSLHRVHPSSTNQALQDLKKTAGEQEWPPSLRFRRTITTCNKTFMTTAPTFRMTTNTLINLLFAV